MIAALFVQKNGVYYGVPDVDPWPEERDARNYSGPHCVVAHPPCAAWCMLAGLREYKYGYKVGEDGGCFESALRSVERFGGVLEHPAYSKAWPRFGLTKPRRGTWTETERGYVTEVSQCAYGHRARKRTWLYAVSGRAPDAMNRDEPKCNAVVSGNHNHCNVPTNRVWSREACRTPIAFRDALLAIAREAR
jgi:hypothetical protein